MGRCRFDGAKGCAGPTGHITGLWWCPAVRKRGEGNFMPCAFAPVTPNNKNTAIVVWILPYFLQAIDENDWAFFSIHQLKECVVDLLDGTPNRRVSPGSTRKKEKRDRPVEGTSYTIQELVPAG